MTGWTQTSHASMNAEQHCEDHLSRPEPGRFAADAAAALFRTVETEIIPRLMLLHRPEAESRQKSLFDSQANHLGQDSVVAFADLILKDRDGAEAFLRNLLRLGIDFEALCLRLMAPAARHLGDLWTADLCSFTDVTIGLARLQGLVRYLSVDVRQPQIFERLGRSALFSPAPGEQHTLGLTMVCDFFRTAGWDVCNDLPLGEEALVAHVRERSFDVLGFSIGSERHVEQLKSLIQRVRAASKNSRVRVLAGGPLLLARPQLAANLGADGTAADARQAMLEAERLVAEQDGGR